MESLEDTLRRISSLRRGLHATRTVGYRKVEDYHEVATSSWNYGMPTGQSGIVFDERIIEDDTEKIELSRKLLQQEYNTSPWYSVRYFIRNEVTRNASVLVWSWFSQLEKELKTGEKDPEIQKKALQDFGELMRLGAFIQCPIIGKKEDFPRIRDLLLKIYHDEYHPQILRSSSIIDEDYYRKLEKSKSCRTHLRKAAGKSLGYSSLRIFAHEHPLSFPLIAGSGIGGAICYFLYQYFSR